MLSTVLAMSPLDTDLRRDIMKERNISEVSARIYEYQSAIDQLQRKQGEFS